MSGSRWVTGRHPPAGSNPIADKIRERRGPRGLTPLDQTLLHVPPVAEGWNSLLGAVRTKGSLPDDIRELMILRVAARNQAAFEWIHHEPVGRKAGLTTEQLSEIRDLSALPSNSSSSLNELQSAALAFADHSTKDVKVPREVMETLRTNLASLTEQGDEDRVQNLLVESATVVATYNMVSRFLVSMDVAGMSDTTVPWPTNMKEHTIPMLSTPTCTSHAVTHMISPDRPWLVFVNSLLTDITMWDHILPFFARDYNLLLHSSRGHGLSSTPPNPTTIPELAKDVANLMQHLNIHKAHAIIGVSQGGAAALAFGTHFSDKTNIIIACDTGPRTAPGNKEAWAERIELARSKGLNALADVTVPRWFPVGSPCHLNSDLLRERGQWIHDMISRMSLDGFACGAAALQDYDLLDAGKEQNEGKSLLECRVKTLLVAGSLDGGGNVPKGMRTLKDKWSEAGGTVEFVEIEGAGHLPMVDQADEFVRIVKQFLEKPK